MDKHQLKQRAIKLHSFLELRQYQDWQQVMKDEVYRIGGNKAPDFIMGMKYVIELAENESMRLRNGEYDG